MRDHLMDTVRTGIHFQRTCNGLTKDIQRTVYDRPDWNRLAVRDRVALRRFALFLILGPEDMSPVMAKTETRLGYPLETGTVWYANFDAWRNAYPTGDPSTLVNARFWKGTDNLYY